MVYEDETEITKLKTMTISFLRAKHGDCINIRHNDKNVIIDSGTPDSDAYSCLIDEVRAQGQRVDLLVITHYDYDHIGGVFAMDSDNWEIVDNVWFNSAQMVMPTVNKENYLSIRQANSVQSALEDFHVKWDRELTRGKVFELGNNWLLKILYGGCDKILDGVGEFLSSPKCDWNATFEELEHYLNDNVLDTTEVNASSIVLLLTDGEHNYLFPGDSTPQVLLDALSDYSETNPLRLDLLKLPHHGSYKNITHEILKKIICSDYVVLTNGKVHFHPNKKMMLKVLNWGRRTDDKIRFHLNYHQELSEKLKISEAEQKKYKFELDGQTEFKI